MPVCSGIAYGNIRPPARKSAQKESRKTTLHTATNLSDGGITLTISHPFHPEKDKTFGYLGLIKTKNGDYVSCFDEQGNLRKFPISVTSLHINDVREGINGAGCVASVENLIALKEYIDALLIRHQV